MPSATAIVLVKPSEPRPVSNLYRNRDYRATFLATTLGLTGCVATIATDMTARLSLHRTLRLPLQSGSKRVLQIAVLIQGAAVMPSVAEETGDPGGPRATPHY